MTDQLERESASEAAGASRAAMLQASLGGVLDSVESLERIAGATAAARAELIDSARRTSEVLAAESDATGVAEAEVGGRPAGTEPEGWNAATRCRRELVFDLAARLRVPERTAERLIEESDRIVNTLTATREALGKGEISYRHAQVILDETSGLSDVVAAEFEDMVVPKAKELTVSKFKHAARKKRESLHPETIEERHRVAVEERAVWIDPQHDGMAILSALLPAETAVAIHDRITRIAMATAATDGDGAHEAGAGGVGAGEAGAGEAGAGEADSGVRTKRTLAQRRADALTDLLLDGDLCATGDPKPHGIRPEVLVTVPVLTLLGQAETPAHLDGYGPISPDTARDLAIAAPSFARILTDPITSAILDFDRTKYAVPADLKRVVRLQHETCTAIGCNKRAVHCQLDHTDQFGGAGGTGTTCLANLSPLCLSHHNLKHHTSVGLRKLADGTMQWTTATGKVVTVRPTNLLGSGLLQRGSPGAAPPGGVVPTGGAVPGGAAPRGRAPSDGSRGRELLGDASPGDWYDASQPDDYPF